MHDIDNELRYMLSGEFDKGLEISDRLEKNGIDKIEVAEGKTKEEMWLRHSFNRGWFLLQQGKYQEGSQLLESGRHINVYGGGILKTNAPIFNPEKHNIENKSIIISLEGGFGDEIIHARFCNSFKKLGADKVYIACAPELKSVLSRIEGCDGVIQRDESHLVKHDFWVPGFSAGWIAGHTYETLPNDSYLSVNPQSASIWGSIINSEKKKVGIRWAGNPKFEHQQFRRFPTEFIFNLAKYTDVQLYSLQRDDNIEKLPDNVVDLQHLLISWEDTLAAISNLDLVITSCTSIAHAAAALGKETWVIVPILPYHIWAHDAPHSTTSPYYKSAKLYRQKSYQDWSETFKNLYLDFEIKFGLEAIEHVIEKLPARKLNLGCGFMYLDGFNNVDSSDLCSPDEIVDLESVPWPWVDNEYDHVVAKDVLEHLGDTPKDFINILKEMYRVSNNGAVWEIQVPHWRCDNAISDPTHKRLLTVETFKIFDKKINYNNVKRGLSTSYLAFEYDIDIEVCEVAYDWIEYFHKKLESNELSGTDFDIAFNTLNNVAESTKLLIQVHKPGRYTREDFKSLPKFPEAKKV